MKDASSAALTLPAFQAALNTRFQVQIAADSHFGLVLVEARATGPTSGDGQAASFSLLFNGPLDPFLPQRTYPFTHEDLGRFDLFIVPVGCNRNGFEYEAVFNHSQLVE